MKGRAASNLSVLLKTKAKAEKVERPSPNSSDVIACIHNFRRKVIQASLDRATHFGIPLAFTHGADSCGLGTDLDALHLAGIHN
eukprot:3372487-Prorocentrum_lima.AAC.1